MYQLCFFFFQTDVIVNTISSERDLSIGQISNALLQKAGKRMQQEILYAPLKGYVIATKPYNLLCKEVYHTCCTEKGKTAAQQVQYKFNWYGAFK